MPPGPTISPTLWRMFGRYAEWFVPRHFHAVRLLAGGAPPAIADRPTIIYLNHPSWWDPMICILLARRFWPERQHYAPMDAAALQRYRFFERLGFFGVEQGSARGGATFLRTAHRLLQQPNATLWITAQGEFTDARSRPIRLRPGLGHLLGHLSNVTVLPLAFEYTFWNEREPEALAAFGDPIHIRSKDARGADVWTAELERRMEQTVDVLAAGAISRNPSRFATLQKGQAGVSFTYDLWRRFKAMLSGERFHREHGGSTP